MALPVYSTSFLQLAGLDGTFTGYPPPGTHLVLRDVWIYSNNGGAFDTTIHFRGDDDQTIYRWDFLAIDSNPNGFWQGRMVIQNHWSIVTTHPSDVSVSGYTLTLP